MIIDSHGHFTTEPQALHDFRAKQVAAVKDGTALPDPAQLEISDDDLRAGVEGNQVRIQRERGIDFTIFSPRAAGMGHHIGGFDVNLQWTQTCNNLINRLVKLYPDVFIPVAQIPQSHQDFAPATVVDEIDRAVNELGCIGINLNPDTSGGYFQDPPLTDPVWFPIYEKMVELDIPAMVHVSGCCNPAMHTTGSFYLNADTMAFMQLIMSDLFEKFPKLRLVIPHGGGAVPYHWGRFRGIALAGGKPELDDIINDNIFFDTCVYHQPGIDLLTKIVSSDNIQFASEMMGAVKGDDPRTGQAFDNTKRYIENTTSIDDAAKKKIFESNIRRIYPRIEPYIAKKLATA